MWGIFPKVTKSASGNVRILTQVISPSNPVSDPLSLFSLHWLTDQLRLVEAVLIPEKSVGGGGVQAERWSELG